MNQKRCQWTGDDPLYITYHDTEWGVPLHDDLRLFEFLLLESFQAGLSWITILRKRENFSIAFDNFDYLKIAAYDKKKQLTLLQNEGIVRNQLKIKAATANAKAFIEIQKEFGSFDQYIWRFTDGKPICNLWKNTTEIPAQTKLSDTISKDLKKRGFQFVGTVIVYAYLQAIGIVNDHTVDCFRYREIKDSHLWNSTSKTT